MLFPKLEGKEETAKAMLQDKMLVAQVMKFTGFTFEHIQILQEKIKKI